MSVWPLRFRSIGDDRTLFADETGSFFVSSEAFLRRYGEGNLSAGDLSFLDRSGHCFEQEGDLAHTAFAARWAARQFKPGTLAYVILVPTLRCNLACSYCQVSRVAESANGYDWTDETTEQVELFLDALSTDTVKVEFQGGEPLLRLDLLERIRAFCRRRFCRAEFVVCTNLQRLGEVEMRFLEANDTFVSTSLDGPPEHHDKRRTQDSATAVQFFANLRAVVGRLAPGHVSALPTIDVDDPPDFEGLVATYEEIGLQSIYLRAVNYQGFARRRPPADHLARWNTLYGRFMDWLIDRNFRTRRPVEEFYFSHCLRRFVQPGQDGHVDLRNPNPLGMDYLIVDHDGRLYPTDEARMLARIGHVDLSIGSVATGVDGSKLDALNAASMNNFDPDCVHCVYQPFCGRDVVDDLSRYGRIDVPRMSTWFCGRHLAIFDRIARLLYSAEPKDRYSLSAWLGVTSLPPELTPLHQ